MPVAQPFLSTPPQVGALAGYSDGLRMSYGLADLDREFRDRDLKNKMDTLKYEEEMANTPLKEAERALKLGVTGIDQSLVDQGLVEQGKRNQFALEDQKVTQGQQKIDDQTRIERGEAVQEGLQIRKNPSLANSEVWSEYYNKMTTKYKMKGLSPDFTSAQNDAVLKAAHDAYINSGPQVRASALLDERAELAKELADKRATASTENARIIAEGYAKKGNTYETAVKSLRLKAESGQPVTAEEVAQVAASKEKADSTIVAKQAADMVGQIRIGNASKGVVERLAKEEGMTDAELAPYRSKEDPSKFVPELLGPILSMKRRENANMIDAWQAGGSPKMSQSEILKVAPIAPKFAQEVVRAGKVLKEGSVPAPSKAPASSPVTSAAPATKVVSAQAWDKAVQANVAKSGKPVAQVEKELRAAGYSTGKPSPVAPMPTSQGMSTYAGTD